MTDFGGKVSKSGYDVRTASARELAFSSKYDTMKVYASGTGDFTANGTQQTDLYAHGLGYRPAFIVYSEVHEGFGLSSTGKFYTMPHSPPFGIGGSLITDTIIVSVDDTYLRIRLGSLVVLSGEVINYKYVIFLNPSK